jgi:rsbT co-antagonist protein RsbR
LAIGLGIVFVALIILAQVLAARALGAPLVALLKGVKQFAAGGIETRVAVVRRDEIGELASAFNDMAATIERQRQNLVQLDVANAARAEAEAARAAITDQLATIEQQRSVIRDMSVPILPLTATTMVMPLVGALDSERIRLVQEQSLRTIQESSARWLILDVTGVPMIDSQVAQGLMQVVQAARLLGVEAVLVGIRPELAQTIVGLGLQLDSIVTRGTLQSGIAYALQQ